MNYEDQVAALFANANPVPSLDLLDPVEALDMEHLAYLSERSSVMTEVETIQPKKEERQRWPRVAFGVAMAVIAVVALGFLINRTTGVASPEAVASAYMNAMADHDGVAAAALFAPDGLADGQEPSTIPAWFDWARAIGQVDMDQGCEEKYTVVGGTFVECSFLEETAFTQALGLEPSTGHSQFVIDEGQIRQVTSIYDDGGRNLGEGFSAFYTWLEGNHSDDIDTLWVGDNNPGRDPAALVLWKQYTDEFVRDMASGGVSPESIANALSIANAFMEARANWDGERAQALFAPDAVISDGGDIHQADQYPAFYDWLRSTNDRVLESDCAKVSTGVGGTLIRCTGTTQNDLSQSLGFAPETGGGQEILVEDGAITTLFPAQSDTESRYGEMWAVFVAWVEDTHPEAIDQMFTPDHMPLYDPSSIALWEKYTDEFVASHGG